LSSRHLRVALFGAGKMGAHHVRAIQAHGRSRLIAILDPQVDPDAAKVISPDAVVYADAETLLREAKPDLVHICTPPASHASLARLCIHHGASVYVEKPFTLTALEAESLLTLAEERGVQVCAGHQLLFEDPAVQMRAHLGKIGRVVHVESYFSFRKVRPNLSMVDQAIDILPHPVYLLVDVLGLAEPGEPLVTEGVQASADGEVRAMVRAGQATGLLIVTLNGRPVDHYLKVVGTNGCLIADFVRGSFTRLDGPGAGFLPMITLPFRQAKQMRRGARRGLWNRIAGGGSSYPGLTSLVRQYHAALLDKQPSPTSRSGILATVALSERAADSLQEAERTRQERDLQALQDAARALPPTRAGAAPVLVTGATGFLGRRVVRELRRAGWPVRAVGRRVPVPSERVAGVEYVAADLGEAIPPSLLDGIGVVVHCAASSDGGKAAHDRGTVAATRHIAAASAQAGIRRLIHISSLAVLKPGSTQRGPLHEGTPVDYGNLERGPYVFAKAEAEAIVNEFAKARTLEVRVIRPGPIVDFAAFEPPGRLGRDLGSHFIAVGSPSSRLSVVDVGTVARVICAYVESFEHAPAVVNLVEPVSPTRGDLLRRTLEARPWLRPVWFPGWLMAIASPAALLAQRFLLKSSAPVNVGAAFASETYDAALARELLARLDAR
jgi:predicted dehydrogenase/nucleoside-diphosphate-sugar epimerase